VLIAAIGAGAAGFVLGQFRSDKASLNNTRGHDAL